MALPFYVQWRCLCGGEYGRACVDAIADTHCDAAVWQGFFKDALHGHAASDNDRS